MSNPFEWIQKAAEEVENQQAQAQMHTAVLRAEFEEMYATLTPRQLFLITSLIAMASIESTSGAMAIGEIRGWIQHHHKADPLTGHPVGHEIFGGEQ